MTSTAPLESLFDKLRAAQAGKPLPPVARWQPDRRGDSEIAIDRTGAWFYRGSEIRRPEMVKLFATILRRDADGFVLVTPVEKLDIEVADAPFIAISMERRGSAEAQELAFLTNVGDVVVAGQTHPIEVRQVEGGPRPYIAVRAGLEALIARSVYYELVALARERQPGVFSVMSGGVAFEIGRA